MANKNGRFHQGTPSVEVETASSSLAKTRPKKIKISNSRHGLNSKSTEHYALSKPSITDLRSNLNSCQSHGLKKNPHAGHSENKQDEDSMSDSEIDLKCSYPKLTATIKTVSRHTIESKWCVLSPSYIENISMLLKNIQLPVVVSFKSGEKSIIASAILKKICHSIVKKISSGILFPQRTGKKREDDFDFMKLSKRNRYLEDQLTPALHANDLLHSALDKEIEYLRIERQRLSNLESNSKKEIEHRNQRFRKLHPTLRAECANSIYDIKEDIGLEPVTYRSSRSINKNVKLLHYVCSN